MNDQPSQLRIWSLLVLASLILATVAGAPMLSNAANTLKGVSADDTLRKHLANGFGVSEKGDFDPTFLKLDRDNGKFFGGVDVLDADPVCQCQDTDGKYHFTGKLVSADRYVARVGDAASRASWQVVLRKVQDAWKIYDVVDDGGSVRGRLERHNACARKKIAHGQSVDDCVRLK